MGEFFCEYYTKTQMKVTILIIAITVLVMLFSIITDKRIRIGKKSFGLYCILPPIGAVALIIAGKLPIDTLISYFVSDTSVNPIKILLLFLSMTVFSLVLDEAGFFTYVASKAVKRTGTNQRTLFFALFITVAFLTVFTSNDVVILTVTPFVIAFCKKANCNPMPHLLLEFVTANTWSMLLVIGNPTNIYVASAYGITFVDYFLIMALPTVVSGIVSVSVVFLIFNKSLRQPMQPCFEETTLKDKPLTIIAGIHLSVCIILLAISNIIDIEMWLVSTVTACLLLVCVLVYLLVRSKPLKTLSNSLKRLPYEIIPFVVGMFAIVLCLSIEGIAEKINTLLKPLDSIFSYGIGTTLTANLINNIPATVLFAEILKTSKDIGAIYATVIGSNIGAYVTPVGALAGIMWHNILSHNGVKLSFGRFCTYGIFVAVPTLLSALVVLKIII